MEDGFPIRITGALELGELEKIVAAANQGLKAAAEAMITSSIVVFAMLPPGMQPRVVKTIPVLSRRNEAPKCAKAARRASYAHLKDPREHLHEEVERLIQVVHGGTLVAAQVQISYPATNSGCVFAIVLPDNAWGWFFPEYIGPLVAVRATRLSLPPGAPPSLRLLCCRNHAAAHTARDENRWRAAALDALGGGGVPVLFKIEMDTDEHGLPYARGVLNMPFSHVIGWSTFLVSKSDIAHAQIDEFMKRHYVQKDENDAGWSDDDE